MAKLGGSKILLAAALAAGGLFVTGGPADAGPLPSCFAGPGHGDSRIRAGSGDYVGIGVFNCNGTDQSLVRTVGAGGRRTFDLRLRNDSGNEGFVIVIGEPDGDTSDFKVKITRPNRDNKNVTDKVFGSGYRINGVSDGKSTPVLRVTITGRETVGLGDAVTVQLGGTINGESLQFADVVEATGGLLL